MSWNIIEIGCTMIIVIGVVLLIAGFIIGYYLEKRDFNNGVCRYCGEKLRYFDADSQGGRGYKCDRCGYHTWVSYNIDKNYDD